MLDACWMLIFVGFEVHWASQPGPELAAGLESAHKVGENNSEAMWIPLMKTLHLVCSII